MIDPRTESLLRETVRREGRSLLRYMGDAFPWTTVRAKDSLANLQQIVHEDGESLNALIRFLGKCRIGLPPLGAYPGWFTTINFVSLKHLQPLLVEAQHTALANLENDLGEISDEAIRAQLQNMLALKRRHLHQLEALAPAQELVARAASV